MDEDGRGERDETRLESGSSGKEHFWTLDGVSGDEPGQGQRRSGHELEENERGRILVWQC